MTLIIFLRFSKVLSHSFCFCRHSNNEPQIFFERQHLNVCHLDLLTTPGQLQNIHDYDHWHIVIILFIGTSFMNPRPAMLDCPIINTLFIQHLHKYRFYDFFFFCAGSSSYIATNNLVRKSLLSTLSTNNISFAPS